jgi:hypothetical protein
MRGESANEMNIYESFQSFVSSGPFRRAENPLAAQNCIVVKLCWFMSKTRYSTLGRQNNLHSN